MKKKIIIFKKLTAILLVSTFCVSTSYAFDCLLDTNNNGIADSNIDTDSSANSDGDDSRVVCGNNAYAAKKESVAIGNNSLTADSLSVAVGSYAETLGPWSVALGSWSDAKSDGDTVVGFAAHGSSSFVTLLGAYARESKYDSYGFSSDHAIAIGAFADIGRDSPGAIAIGGNSVLSDTIVHGDNKGSYVKGSGAIAIGADAKAIRPGAIALGAGVLANKANTMTVGAPIEVIRNDGTSKITIGEQSGIDKLRTMFTLDNYGAPSLAFKDSSPGGASWNLRGSSSKRFVISKQHSDAIEMQVLPGGNVIIAGTLTESSSRNNKKQIKSINVDDVLTKVENLPIHQWTYKHEANKVKHIGPMAEDFYQAFELGATEKGIASIDVSGVALAAIKALNKENKNLESKLAAQSAEIA